jgi:hypothetical protein
MMPGAAQLFDTLADAFDEQRFFGGYDEKLGCLTPVETFERHLTAQKCR